jgi:hypothetical protein
VSILLVQEAVNWTGWRLLDYVPLGAPRDRPQGQRLGLSRDRPFGSLRTGPSAASGQGGHAEGAPSRHRGNAAGSNSFAVLLSSTPLEYSGQAGQAVQAWSRGFVSVGCIVPLQNILPFCGLCDMMWLPGSHNKVPRKRRNRSRYSESPEMTAGGVV